MHRNRAARNRDVALTTLIDLLVQIIFVFTLILVAADAMGSTSQTRGWVTPDVWKTLISVFDVDPRGLRDVNGQVTEIKGKYDRLNANLQACNSRLGACDKQAGRGPGNPPCLTADGAEMIVARATIDHEGKITVAPERHAGELQALRPLGAEAMGHPLSVRQFVSSFRPWRQHGLSRQPPCAFKAELSYDSRAPAGSYEPARRAIAIYFTLSAPPRRF